MNVNEKDLLVEAIELVKASRPRDPALKSRREAVIMAYTELMRCPIESISIHARRWQNSMGNTMFTAMMHVHLRDGGYFTEWLKEYGYGEQYVWCCKERLIKKGYIESEASDHLSTWCRNNNVKFEYGADDVSRRKDLHNV